MKTRYKILLLVSVFAAAMGFMESAVVVYLRELFYPNGFQFPLNSITTKIAVVEAIREAATIIMLISVAYIAGTDRGQRFAFFLWSFAIWDIGYYVYLKLILGWPESLMSWDVLFLLPVTWVGPVITPIILSVLMMVHAYLLIRFRGSRISSREWILLIAGSLFCLASFMIDHIRYLIDNNISLSELSQNHLSIYFIPDEFNWFIYLSGVFLISAGILHFYVRNRGIKTDLQRAQLF